MPCAVWRGALAGMAQPAGISRVRSSKQCYSAAQSLSRAQTDVPVITF